MSDTAKQRIAALGSQLSPQGNSSGGFEGMPAIKRVAGASNGPRVQGKVIIITGRYYASAVGLCQGDSTLLHYVRSANRPCD